MGVLIFGAVMALGVAAVCMLRMTLQIDLRHDAQTRGRILLRVWKWRHVWHLALVRTAQGHQLVLADQPGEGAKPLSPAAMQGTLADHLLHTLNRAAKVRRYLFHHLLLERLDGMLCLRLEDAARCALISGTLQSATAWLPPAWRNQVRIRVLPDFFREHSTLQLRCILHLRLGTLLITGCMLLTALKREACAKKEAES